MTNWREDRIGGAERGENPTVLMRMASGWAVIGDTQHLHGHVHARYEWEPEEHKGVPVWRYDDRKEPQYALGPQHDLVRAAITRELRHVTDGMHLVT